MKPVVHFRGNGPRLYVHPGGPGLSSREFAPDCGGLERSFEVGYIDPRGTGSTPKPESSTAYSLDDYVDDLASLIREPAYVLGFSHGGLVAQRFAVRYPQRLLGLVLASTAARFSSDVDAALQRKIERSRGEPWLDDALRALDQEQRGDYRCDAELAAILAREMPLYFHALGTREKSWLELIADDPCNGDALRAFNAGEFQNIDLRTEIDRIKTKTVIVSGAEDFVCPPRAGKEMHELIRGSTFITIPEAGHMTFVEQPEGFYEAVSAVLK